MNSVAAFILGLIVGVAFGWLTLGLCISAKRAFDDHDYEYDQNDEDVENDEEMS